MNTFRILVPLALALAPVLFGQQLADDPSIFKTDDPDYKSYTNARFQYSVKFAWRVLQPQPEAGNGDGREFYSADGKAKMAVWGQNNVLKESIADKMASSVKRRSGKPGGVVTLQKKLANGYVVSGKEANRIFYEKETLSGDVWLGLLFEYDETVKSTYDKYVEKAVASMVRIPPMTRTGH
jgi:hypothetical protein